MTTYAAPQHTCAMTTYAVPQAEAVSARVGPSPSRSSPTHSSQAPPTIVSGAATVAFAPPSTVHSAIHQQTPLQPNRHHPLPDSSWHDRHARLKGNHVPLHLPPPSTQPSRLPSHHTKVAKPDNPESQSLHHPHADSRAHERSSYIRERAPEAATSYHHTVNVVAPHHPGSRLTAPTHHTSYLYPVHQLVTPVAHVPIGAAHYAHLPPSIWSPPHAQYHQHPHPQTHQLPPAHHVSPAVVSTPHGQVPYAASHVHHVAAPTPPPPHAYALPAPHTATTPHPPPPGPPHAVHPASHHPQQHITYTYAQVQAPPPTHHAVKSSVTVSPSEPIAIGAPVPYTISPTHLPQPAAGTSVSAQMPCKVDTVLTHASHAEQAPPRNSNCPLTTGEGVKPYEKGKRPGSVRTSSGTNDRLDTSPPRLSKGRPLLGEDVPAYGKADRRRDSNQKDKGQLTPGQPIRKPRKPYTIKKSREVWTPEEHSRFLQALQLYDRDWKKIESYIGTKSVLQIRSHAQKHFGKVTKYKTGEYIPPPRPKKRATLPYPRSRSTGQSKSNSANGNDADKTTGGENSAHVARDVTVKDRISPIKFSTDGKQGTQKLNDAINRSAKSAPVAPSDSRSKQPATKLPHETEVEDTEIRSGSSAYGDKYPASSYERQNDKSEQECTRRGKLPQTNPPIRWHPAPPSEETVREQAVPRASSSPTDVTPGTSSYASRPEVHHRRSSTYSEDLGQREIQYARDYRQGTSLGLVSSENNSSSQREDRHPPKRLSSSQSVEHDSSTMKESGRKRMAMPNNSLLVLSHCVDLMSRDTLPERQPAAGWATAAAARRAHRAKVIRARKPTLPQPSIPTQVDNPAHGDKESPRRASLDSDTEEQSSRQTRDHDTLMKSASSRVESQSPPVNSPSEYGCDQPPPDPQRSSSGSGTGSDDAIAGFSSSDHPSVSGSAAGSGTGGSLGTSDNGDPEEDPKSSNDGGSGDDGNRLSPPTRDLYAGDPNSSASREHSPNECPTPQPRNGGSPEQVDSALQKAPERSMTAERYEQVSHRDRGNMDCKNVRTATGLNHGDRENGRYDGSSEDNGNVLSNGDERKSYALPRSVLSANDDQRSLHGRPPHPDRGARVHSHTVHMSSPSSKKRLRPNTDYEVLGQTDGRIDEDGRELESKRQRVRNSVKEANNSTDQRYQGVENTERKR